MSARDIGFYETQTAQVIITATVIAVVLWFV